MLFVEPLRLLEDLQQSFRLLCRAVRSPKFVYDLPLARDAPGTFSHVPPGHFQLGLAVSHSVTLVEVQDFDQGRGYTLPTPLNVPSTTRPHSTSAVVILTRANGRWL